MLLSPLRSHFIMWSYCVCILSHLQPYHPLLPQGPCTSVSSVLVAWTPHLHCTHSCPLFGNLFLCFGPSQLRYHFFWEAFLDVLNQIRTSACHLSLLYTRVMPCTLLPTTPQNVICEIIYLKFAPALAGVAWWIECWPANQKIAGLIPHEDTCLGLWARFSAVGAWEAADWCFHPSLSPFPFL